MRKANLHTIHVADTHNMDVRNWLKNRGKFEKKEGSRTAFGASIGRDKFNEGKRIVKNFPPPSSPHYDIGIIII